jgi:hypothetical protein
MKGERRGDEALNTPSVEEYDPAMNIWRDAGALKHARHGFAAAVWGGRVYVFGGNDGETERRAEAWDPHTGTSTDLPTMPVGRGFGAVVQYDGRLICFGGRIGARHPSALDPVARRWTDSPIADIDLRRFGSIVIGTSVWTIGGEGRGQVPIVRRFDLCPQRGAASLHPSH